METKYADVHIPAGCEVLVGDTVDSLISLGVIPEETESSVNITYEVAKVQGSRSETVAEWIRNMVANCSTALYQINMKKINMLAGGVMQISEVAGTAVTGETFTAKANTFAKGAFILIPGQNMSGEKQSITKVAQGSTTLAADTDYIQMKTEAGWGILILPASTAAINKDLTVTYNYTPSKSVKATMGAGSVEIQSKIVRFKKVVNGKTFQVTLYSAVMTNGINLSFPAESSDSIPSLPVEITGSLDTSRAQGDQLLEIYDEIGVA